VLWLLGLVSSYTLGGFIHILLVDRDHHRDREPGAGAQVALAAQPRHARGDRGSARRPFTCASAERRGSRGD
jgi:hypothetical protein